MSQIQKKITLIFSVIYLLLFHVIYPMNPLEYRAYFAISKNEYIVNDETACILKNSDTGEEEILYKNNPQCYRKLFTHPTKSWIGLSGEDSIEICNYKTKKYQSFKIPILYYAGYGQAKPIISECIFHPYRNIIAYHRLIYPNDTIYCIDYEGENIEVKHAITLHHGAPHCIRSPRSDCVMPAGFILSFNPNPKKTEELYIEDSRSIAVFDFTTSKFSCFSGVDCSNTHPVFSAFTSDGFFWVSFDSIKNKFNIFETNNRQKLHSIERANSMKNMRQICLHSYLPVLITLASDGVLQYWYVPTGEKFANSMQLSFREKADVDNNFRSLSCSSDGTKIVVLNNEKELITNDFFHTYTKIREYFLCGKWDSIFPEFKHLVYRLWIQHHIEKDMNGYV